MTSIVYEKIMKEMSREMGPDEWFGRAVRGGIPEKAQDMSMNWVSV